MAIPAAWKTAIKLIAHYAGRDRISQHERSMLVIRMAFVYLRTCLCLAADLELHFAGHHVAVLAGDTPIQRIASVLKLWCWNRYPWLPGGRQLLDLLFLATGLGDCEGCCSHRLRKYQNKLRRGLGDCTSIG